jgi:hypothetical protein
MQRLPQQQPRFKPVTRFPEQLAAHPIQLKRARMGVSAEGVTAVNGVVSVQIAVNVASAKIVAIEVCAKTAAIAVNPELTDKTEMTEASALINVARGRIGKNVAKFELKQAIRASVRHEANEANEAIVVSEVSEVSAVTDANEATKRTANKTCSHCCHSRQLTQARFKRRPRRQSYLPMRLLQTRKTTRTVQTDPSVVVDARAERRALRTAVSVLRLANHYKLDASPAAPMCQTSLEWSRSMSCLRRPLRRWLPNLRQLKQRSLWRQIRLTWRFDPSK